MRIDLLGTGSCDRWPNPWCACERCAWAREANSLRDRTSALVDHVLLIDPGPDAGARGADLTSVRTVLITHDHPDHLDPAFLLAWSWAGGTPLTVAGPPAALDRCRAWVGPQAAVRWVPLQAGDEFDCPDHARGSGDPGSGLRVRAVPAAHSSTGGSAYDGTALLYEVAGPNATLFYATDTAALPHDNLGGPYDVVLLELTFGDHTEHGAAHLDLPGFAREVTRLRADGRLAAAARVVAVHLSHHNPADLAARLTALGAEVLPDGATVRTDTCTQPEGPGPGRRLLITGGARSGKSRYAETLAAGRGVVTYLATAPAYPDDPEWVARITAHRRRRPPHWQVLETCELAGPIAAAGPGQTLLVDCLTLWVTNLIDDVDGWSDCTRASAAVHRATTEVIEALRRSAGNVVLVTNEVGSGIAPDTSSGRLFRDLLGHANAAIAEACDDVVQVVSGIPQLLKGRSWTWIST